MLKINFVLLFILIPLLLILNCACTAQTPPTVEINIASTEAINKDDTEEININALLQETEHELTAAENEALFIEEIIHSMDLKERVSQLFILELGENLNKNSDELTRIIPENAAGGYILFQSNISTLEGTKTLTDTIKNLSKIPPFICLDEEGGAVSRLQKAGLPGYNKQPTAYSIGVTNDAQQAYRTGLTIGKTLASLGVNVDFAPVADIVTNPRNKVIGSRSFGSDPILVSNMVSAFQAGLHTQGIMSAPKHFPGHGNTYGDSHLNSVLSESSPAQLASVEYIPFIRAINEGAEFIMIGHIIAPQAEPAGLPATLSFYFVTDILRNELGFTGISITDAMNMGAITKHYSSAEAAVLAIAAGIDMILMPEDYPAAIEGVLLALQEGVLSSECIDESLRRILHTKLTAKLIQ